MNLKRILDVIESVSNSVVCFVGDAIIDEYRYVVPLQRSPKENLVPVEWTMTEQFQGGVHAAAKHLQSFCLSVDVLCTGPVTRKVRMVEHGTLRKLFEFQYKDGVASDGIRRRLDDYDILVVTDFGHGEITKDGRQMLCEMKSLTAVNTQTNAANYGFNLITNYRRADYIVIDEPEARLAAHDAHSRIEEVIEKLADGRCQRMIVTRGSEGAVGFDGTHFSHIKAFAKRPVDTMGAGDAFFAVTAPMFSSGTVEDLLYIGSAAAALKCNIIGHREPVTKDAVVKFLKEMA